MTRISSYKLYECSKCGQGHIDPIYDLIDFRRPPPPNKKLSDLVICQRCSARMPLNEFIYIGVKEKPRRNYSTWVRIVRKLKGIKFEPSPVDLYPFLSSKPFDPTSEAERFKKFGMKPEQFPTWFRGLAS
ncbi:hypothetical protein G6712_02330 [Polynucleobacter paneuropaeus]|nr:hypothetical protein [Polynucleobacter paneuropaeus]